jgi:hypothetical protein
MEARESLVKEIEGDEFHLSPIQGKIMLNDIEDILNKHTGKSLEEIENEFIKAAGIVSESILHEMFMDINDFICINPQIPDFKKNYVSTPRLKITNENTRSQIIELVNSNKENSELALLALYVYRQMDIIDWAPFIKAAIERNPVSFTDLNGRNISEVYNLLINLSNESIYDGCRLALPDEVWNFRRGDGIEKALLLADFLIHKNQSSSVSIVIDAEKVLLTHNGTDFHFSSNKNLKKSIFIDGKTYEIV